MRVIALPPVAPGVNEIVKDVVPTLLEVNAVGADGAEAGIVTERVDEFIPLPIVLMA
jgi:hypothetical protein